MHPRRITSNTSRWQACRGLYNDSWMLSSVPLRAPWALLGKAIENPATAYKMGLCDVRHDWTQSTDVAADNPVSCKR